MIEIQSETYLKINPINSEIINFERKEIINKETVLKVIHKNNTIDHNF